MKINSLKRALKVAREIFGNKESIKDLFNETESKSANNKDRIESGLWYDLKMLKSMLKAWLSGSYKFSKRTILYVIAGMLYFVSPVDMIPDMILGLGFIDDAAVLALAVKRIKGELEKYKENTHFQDAEVLL